MSDERPSYESKVTANFVSEIQKSLRLMGCLYRSSRVPLWVKVIPFLGLLYWLNPIDPLPPPFNLTPIDDLAALLIGFKLLVELSPQDLVESLRYDLEYGTSNTGNNDNGEVIDASYEVLDDE